MSRIRRFGGHEAVICISKICGSIGTSRWGFSIWFLLFLDITCDQLSLVRGLRGMAGQKGACSRLLEEALFALLLLDLAQPAHQLGE